MKAPLGEKIFKHLSEKNLSASFSYAQEGEDLILNRFFEKQPTGFFVDVGAHHPFRFSNTYFFYKLGWRGINIDPMPGIMKKFNHHRPGDINIEAGISNTSGAMDFFIFDEPAVNTFSTSLAKKIIEEGKYKLVKKQSVILEPLAAILDKHLAENCAIDFLSIDAEGFDMNVLLSNNWDKYKPKIILIESHKVLIDEFMQDEIYFFLSKHNYKLAAKTYFTYFFIYAEHTDTFPGIQPA